MKARTEKQPKKKYELVQKIKKLKAGLENKNLVLYNNADIHR